MIALTSVVILLPFVAAFAGMLLGPRLSEALRARPPRDQAEPPPKPRPRRPPKGRPPRGGGPGGGPHWRRSVRRCATVPR
ncbi:hypothetical protein [Actinomadura keratinilytica]|uniref:hypothetical protein n=1 Tax=Actinomadura keratinilytica TaxID=547461 RepID=UPI0036079D5D